MRVRCAARPLFLIAGAMIAAGLVTAPASASQLSAPAGGPIYEAIVLDAETGQVLRQLNPDTVTYPASLTKMMTLYLTFEALNQDRLRLDQYLPVSEEAASQRPSKLGLRPGQSVTVQDLILAIVTKSANDAAVVLAEELGGGSEPGERSRACERGTVAAGAGHRRHRDDRLGYRSRSRGLFAAIL